VLVHYGHNDNQVLATEFLEMPLNARF